MRRVALVLGAGLVVAVALAIGGIVWTVRGSLPRVSGTAELPGLSKPVTVIRDRAGVPHVFAASAADAQRGLGFAQAQDRRLGLEFTRRLALGRLAEVAGDGPLGEPIALGPVFATTALEADRQMRALGLERLARQDLELMPPEHRALLAAWADGVNAATESGAAGGMIRLLGVSVEPWTSSTSSGRVHSVRYSAASSTPGRSPRPAARSP